MRTVIETNGLMPSRRVGAWRDAVCNTYAYVDIKGVGLSNLNSTLRIAKFGRLNITDCVTWPQIVQRHHSHIASADRTSHFLQIVTSGQSTIQQNESELPGDRRRSILFSATEPYQLNWMTAAKAMYVEIPLDMLGERSSEQDRWRFRSIDVGYGLGHILARFVVSLVEQENSLASDTKVRLGEQLIDLISASIATGEGRPAADSASIQRSRLTAIEAYIEENLSDPRLSLETVARSNGISVRYLHRLFRIKDTSPGDWIRSRRLHRSSDLLASLSHAHLSITDIAFSLGFNSSSHFSTAFKEAFGISPSDIRRTAVQRHTGRAHKPSA